MEDDLVIAFQLLLCVLEFYIKRCPSSLLQPLYSKQVTLDPFLTENDFSIPAQAVCG